MIDDMPRPRPPHLQRETTRHGRSVWYVRVGRGPRIRLRAEYGTPEFVAEYQAAIEGKPRASKGTPEAGTLAWLIARYRETTAWTALSVATKQQRGSIFGKLIEAAGTKPIGAITADVIAAARDRRTPHQARHFVTALRGMFAWARSARLIKADPTAAVELPPKKVKGFRPWTEADVAAYETRWPIGTRQRVWLDVLLYTGLRRGDAVRLGRQHVRNGVAEIATEKNGTVVTLPILPVLQATLDAGPTSDLAFICGERGHPLTKGNFGHEFLRACRAAGVKGSAHGVRKIAATRAAEAGATVAQIEAIFGWSGGKMASLYTKAADRRRLAIEAMHKLDTERTSIPAPSRPVRAAGRKSK